MAGVAEYTAEYEIGLKKAIAITVSTGATLTIIGTTPCHNCVAGTDATVVALNVAAAALAKQ
jgi:hypothetical protein